jgi:hypothetical protein
MAYASNLFLILRVSLKLLFIKYLFYYFIKTIKLQATLLFVSFTAKVKKCLTNYLKKLIKFYDVKQ